MPKVNRALISVSDKTDVVWLARQLEEMGVEIISTGGTYKLLSQEGVTVTPVAEVTGFPEMLDGRVKTLHPKIHGGILADRSKPEHMRQLEFQKIGPIDLVVVNLYPFAQTVAKPGVTREDAIENIDIGGPTMVRAAAKNHEHVAIVVNPARYHEIVEEMRRSGGELSSEALRALAREAFAHTAAYDAMISDYLSKEVEVEPGAELPDRVSLSFDRVATLRYGENPHQSAALYAETRAEGVSLASAPQVAGPALSFNNILDGEAAWNCSLEFDRPACVIIKHNNPCGAAVSDNLALAYQKAFDCDPASAYGSVIAFNRSVDKACAEAMLDNFIELLIAPRFEPDALATLTARKDIRMIELGEGRPAGGMDCRRIRGGLLLQDYDTDPYDVSTWRVMTSKAPSDEQWEDLLFAWKVAKHVKSNAILLARGGATVGVGAGQMSRVDAASIAVEKAGDRASGCSVASDAFFPFPDAVEKVVSAGALAIAQPGGSKRDEEALAVCESHGVSMVFTGRRHFRH